MMFGQNLILSHSSMDSKILLILDKKWEDVTESELHYLISAWVINGCWGRWQYLLQKVLRKLRPTWEKACCNHHDFGYAKGWSEEDRKQCDLKFFSAMCDDWYDKIDAKFEFTRYILLCLVAYYLIRWQGGKYFNYHP